MACRLHQASSDFHDFFLFGITSRIHQFDVFVHQLLGLSIGQAEILEIRPQRVGKFLVEFDAIGHFQVVFPVLWHLVGGIVGLGLGRVMRSLGRGVFLGGFGRVVLVFLPVGSAARLRVLTVCLGVCRIAGEQEPGSGGKDSAGAFIKLLNGFSVQTEKTSGSKELRADPLSAQINAGNFRIVRGDWNADYIEELRQFPRGRHDDQVDATSLAFNRIATFRRLEFSEFRF